MERVYVAWMMVGNELPVLLYVGEPGKPPQFVYNQARKLISLGQECVQVGTYDAFSHLSSFYAKRALVIEPDIESDAGLP